MRIADNTISALRDFYHRELKRKYPGSEADAIFRVVVQHFLNIPYSEIPMRMEDRLNQSDVLRIYDACKEILTGRPIQYVLGETFFYGLRILVNAHVLIPRPETEELVDLIIRENPSMKTALDIGTGSGCIALALASKLKAANIEGCDVSAEALSRAKENAHLNKLQVIFFEKDILQENALEKKSYDLFVSNPPYVLQSEKSTLLENVLNHEPHNALFVPDNDAVVFYRRIIELCGRHLNAAGKLYFELNPVTANEVKAIAERSGLFSAVDLRNDMSGNTRFLSAVKS